MSVTMKFAVFAVFAPLVPGLKGSEKQVGCTYDSEADALHALKLAKVPNATLEVRGIPCVSAEEKQAIAQAKVIEKEVAKAEKTAKASFTREISAIAKAIVLDSETPLEKQPLLANLSPEIRDRVIAKVAEFSLPENKGKLLNIREAGTKSVYKPLSFPGLAEAIGVERLDHVAPFPKRPDSHDGLLPYLGALQVFERALARKSVVVTNDHGQNALYRAALRSALTRIANEIETVNYYAHQRREEVVTNRIVSHGKEFVEREAMASVKCMPPWPRNDQEKPEKKSEAIVAEKVDNSLANLAPDLVANVERFRAQEKAKERTRKIATVIRREIGPGFAEQFAKRPVCQTKDYSRGSLSNTMSVKNYVATFSKG